MSDTAAELRADVIERLARAGIDVGRDEGGVAAAVTTDGAKIVSVQLVARRYVLDAPINLDRDWTFALRGASGAPVWSK